MWCGATSQKLVGASERGAGRHRLFKALFILLLMWDQVWEPLSVPISCSLPLTLEQE